MKQFIHLGMPKALSSLLQADYFSKHPDIYFLGVGTDTLVDYLCPETNRLFDSLIPFANFDYYEQNKSHGIQALHEHLRNAMMKSKGAFGVSSEWLGFNFTPEMVDPELKIKRLADCFDEDVQIIFIVREQMSLIRSLWGELIKVGMKLNFSEYLYYLWHFQDRNHLLELCYDLHIERLGRYFNIKNIHIIKLEDYRDSSNTLIKNDNRIAIFDRMSEILGVPLFEPEQTNHINPSLSKAALFEKQILNNTMQHDFGRTHFEPSNIHRARMQLKSISNSPLKDFFNDVKIKRKSIREANELAMTGDTSGDPFSAPIGLAKELEDFFKISNDATNKILGWELY